MSDHEETPEPQKPAEPEEVPAPEAPAEQKDAAEPEKPIDSVEPADPVEADQPDASDASDASDVSDDSKQPAKQLPPEALALARSAIEAMLFSSPEPVSSRALAEALRDTGVDGRGVRKLIRDLAAEYEAARRGFTIEEVAGGFKMVTRPDYAEYVVALLGGCGEPRLSQAALETLAVVAYKQPVTRADIEAIRGVQAGPLLRTLLHKGLVRITGRAEVLGRPLLYGTTRRFLEHFGLKSLNELPKVEELPKP